MDALQKTATKTTEEGAMPEENPCVLLPQQACS